MKLWLLRHGEAAPYAGDDAARELTSRGRQQVGVMGALLRKQSLAKVYASPYLRAQQSARLLGLAGAGVVTVPWLVPETEPMEVLRQLDDSQSSILLVAHQPLLGELAGLLVHGNRRQALALGTADLVELEGELLAGLMALRAVHRPGC